MSDYQPNDRVIIRENPHDREAVGIVGRVVRVEPCGDMPLYFVAYDGCEAEGGLPISVNGLESGDSPHLIALAEEHEAKAAELRRLAGEATE